MAEGRQAVSPAGSHDIDEDIAFQQRQWIIQRVAWIVMTLLVVASLLGLAGGGGLISDTTDQSADGALTLRYDRIVRMQASTQVELDLATGASDQVGIWMDQEFLSGVEIESIQPEPTEIQAGVDRQIFLFAVADGAQDIQVSLQYRHQGFGPTSGNIGIVEGPELEFGQLVVP